MTTVIPQKEWAQFFDDLTKRRFDWKTKVEVIGNQIGNQTLADGLPLVGITYEDQHGKGIVEIIVGNDRDHHQTHNIGKPASIAYLGETDDPSGIVEIEENDGTKTLVRIIAPRPIRVKGAAASY